MCSSTVRSWYAVRCSYPIAGSNSGSSAASTPVSRARRSALRGSPPRSSLDSSPMPSAARPPPIRSAETSSTDAACSRICASVAGSGSKPSCETNRRPRTIRSGSSAKLRSETVRSSLRSRSSRPPCGSTSVPSASRRAIALIVKSRRPGPLRRPRRRRPRSRSRAGPARSTVPCGAARARCPPAPAP